MEKIAAAALYTAKFKQQCSQRDAGLLFWRASRTWTITAWRNVFGREHPGQHGIVGALDTRHIDESGGAADQRAARKKQASAPIASRPR